MIVFCVTLLLLHQGYSLVPVTTVRLGEPANFTCVLSDEEFSRKQFQWYKQSAGDDLKLIVAVRKHTNHSYGPEFSASRLDVRVNMNTTSLTILKTTEEDEGMYHCAVLDWLQITWSGTYLSIKGNNQRKAVIQSVSDQLRPGDPVTLQCSVLSQSEDKMCAAGGHKVFWFRAGSDESHPNIIYADAKRSECDTRSEPQSSCVYHVSKNVSSSDTGTYFCAVAACGEILFGNGTKQQVSGTSVCSQTTTAVTGLLCAVLAVFLLVTAVLIYAIKTNKCDCHNTADTLQNTSGAKNIQQRDKDVWIYSAAVFTAMKSDRGAMKDAKAAAERERIYAAVKAFGLN